MLLWLCEVCVKLRFVLEVQGVGGCVCVCDQVSALVVCV